MTTLYDTFRTIAQKHADKCALFHEGAEYTYEQILNGADQWANFLLKTSTPDRPRVCLISEDPFHSVTISLGLAKINGCCVPTNAQMTAEQLAIGWNAADINMVVYEPCFTKTIKNAPTTSAHFICTDQLTNSSPDIAPLQKTWQNEDDFLITLSSGSTGQPKPIIISQRVKLNRAKQTWNLYDLTHKDVALCASPFFHSMGQRMMFVPLLLGASVVHLSTFTPAKWLDAVERYKVTYITAVSSHLYGLKDDLLQNSSRIQSLKTIVSSSAPIDAGFKDTLFNAIGCDFHEIYGATEIAIASNLFPKDATTKYATVGTPVAGVDIKILYEENQELSQNKIGEIVVKTPQRFEGYYKRPDLNKAAMWRDYFKTGDLGYMDTDGFLSYVSRKKDIIISGGINIYPGDIENVINKNKYISECSVIGVEDNLLGEVVVAICVKKKTDQDIERNLRILANTHLAAFQRPLKYFFVDDLPKTATGKISKMELRNTFNKLNDGWTDIIRTMIYGR